MIGCHMLVGYFGLNISTRITQGLFSVHPLILKREGSFGKKPEFQKPEFLERTRENGTKKGQMMGLNSGSSCSEATVLTSVLTKGLSQFSKLCLLESCILPVTRYAALSNRVVPKMHLKVSRQRRELVGVLITCNI